MITVGQFLIAAGLLDLVIVPLMARSVLGKHPDALAEQRRDAYFLTGAGIVSGISLVLAGLFLPIAQLQIV
jgi:hypothetical protein